MHHEILDIHDALKSIAEKQQASPSVKPTPDGNTLTQMGVRMRDVFDLAKIHMSMDLPIVEEMLGSDIYELRMIAVSILDFKARSKKLTDADRKALYDMYMDHLELINLWDFVDRAAPRVVGWYLLDKDRTPMFALARSERAIERRTAITASFWWIRQGDLEDAMTLIDMLLEDESELVTRPVGTALREVGKIDEQFLRNYLESNEHRMKAHTSRVAKSRL